MSAMAWPQPGVVWGEYPERDPAASTPTPGVRPPGSLWREVGRIALGRRRLAPHDRFARRVLERVSTLPATASLGTLLHDWRSTNRRDTAFTGARHEGQVELFALASLALRQTLGLTPHATQLMAAHVLQDDAIAEMATGEGKTIALALAAAVAALCGTPVHLVTANDYLARRDAVALEPFYAALGLSVGHVIQSMDADARRAAYRCPVTYGTAKELAFDYLRDGLSRPDAACELERRAQRLGTPEGAAAGGVLRGLCMALVDEIDTVLIDEATVPLVLSRPVREAASQDLLVLTLEFARGLRAGVHFTADGDTGRFLLSAEGRRQLAGWSAPRRPPFNHDGYREEMVLTALSALHTHQRDRHYVVVDGQVRIVDETTGRAATGRNWSRGLHQMIERKEGLGLTPRTETAAQINYQGFFSRYLRLGGMSGTIGLSALEMAAVHGLGVVRIATALPSRRIRHPARYFIDDNALWKAVAQRAGALRAEGRPVLVGTSTVAASQALSQALHAAGLPHAVLNARQDADENGIVAMAGQAGQITVATSMAGRGTDIALGPGVAQRGGLHVILCQHNPSPRIDRQFLGRAARRGEPGSSEIWRSLDSPILREVWPPFWLGFLRQSPRATPVLAVSFRVAQWVTEYSAMVRRRALFRSDQHTARQLAFSRRTG